MNFWGVLISWAIIALVLDVLLQGLGFGFEVGYWIIFIGFPAIALLVRFLRHKYEEK